MPNPPLDHYRLLGVAPDASVDEIVSAWRARAQVCHPDRVAGSPEPVVKAASQLMSLLNEARAVLCDPGARAAYDASRRVAEAPPAPARRYVPLRIAPDRLVARDVAPGTPVVAVVRVESPVAQFGEPRLRAPEPGLVVECDVLHRSSRRAQIRVRIHTNLLAEHRTYEMDLAADWGTAIGIVSLSVTTTELREWNPDEPQRTRMRHPSSRSRRVPGAQRRRALAGWAIGGLVTPVSLMAWAGGRLPLPPPSGVGGWQLACLAVIGAGAYPLVATRGFSRVAAMRRGFGAIGMAVVRFGSGVLWVGAGLVRLSLRKHRRGTRESRGRIRIGRR